jgi:prepilin-type N-terminal cleavage/methylation domain-containing protein
MYAGPRTNRHAFTVIELMVVLTILTLLMGILIPAVSQARRQARRQVVATQLQQVGPG